ncbi:MAG: hypothetical protein HYY44_06450 [Deltaproteobacteria bacterium]|nr:hypothetical protein [Deltaproteobacteria bacterium]
MIRRGSTEAGEPSPAAFRGEILGTVVALALTAVGPNILVVALTPGMPEMPHLVRYLLIPSIIGLGTLTIYSKAKGWVVLSNRLWTGIWTGAAATGTLDAVRLTGFYLGLMPGNMPRMFGVLILNTMATGPTVSSDLIGYLYHYWVGACFGLTLALICGKVRWWAGLIWGLIIEIGMMTTPPMVVAMDTGFFGLKEGFGLLGTSLAAHIVYGTCLGLLVERYVRHRGSLFSLIYFKKGVA